MRTLCVAVIVAAVGGMTLGQTAAPRPSATAPATTTVARPIDPVKMKDIRELIRLSGQAEMQEKMTQTLIGFYKQQRPDVPDAFWTKFEHGIDSAEFVDMLVPIYDRHFSADEVKELIRFWQSAVGQKLVKQQPAMTDEGMRAGRLWGERLAAKANQSLTDAGFGPPATTSAPATRPGS